MPHSRSLLTMALVATALLPACRDSSSDGRGPDSAARAVADSVRRRRSVESVVAQFGARMQTVSLLAPDSIVRSELRQAYGTLVTPELLAAWLANPALAPGRRVSSPWPDSIHVLSVRPLGNNEFEVAGEVVYVTSAERAHEGRAASTPPASVRVRLAPDSSWRISAYAEDSTAPKT